MAEASISKKRKRGHPKGKNDPKLKRWPSGRIITLPPKKHIVGLRNPEFHGCGKCRHRPTGCRSCILYDQAYPFVPSNRMLTLPDGVILQDFEVPASTFSSPISLPSGRGLSRLKETIIWTTVKVGQSELDKGNYGVFAAVDIPEGAILIDPSVTLVPRDSAYARAHFNEYDFVNVGVARYILLREPELGMRSITYYLNEANHLGEVGQKAHIEWRIKKNQLIWKFNHTVRKGEEILVRYCRDL